VTTVSREPGNLLAAPDPGDSHLGTDPNSTIQNYSHPNTVTTTQTYYLVVPQCHIPWLDRPSALVQYHTYFGNGSGLYRKVVPPSPSCPTTTFSHCHGASRNVPERKIPVQLLSNQHPDPGVLWARMKRDSRTLRAYRHRGPALGLIHEDKRGRCRRVHTTWNGLSASYRCRNTAAAGSEQSRKQKEMN
jgi:hypothetical protein